MYIRLGYERVSILQLHGKYLLLNLRNIGLRLEAESQKSEPFDRSTKGRQKEKHKGVNDKLQTKKTHKYTGRGEYMHHRKKRRRVASLCLQQIFFKKQQKEDFKKSKKILTFSISNVMYNSAHFIVFIS